MADGVPFIVYALGRSRTAWLSRFLSYRDWACYHEQAIRMRSLADVRYFFGHPRRGTVENSAAQGWRIIHHAVPGIRAAVIRRPIDEIMDSILCVDLRGIVSYDAGVLRNGLNYGDRMLRQIGEQPGVLTLDYRDLATDAGCAAIFEHCLPYRFDRAHWLALRDHNIQIDVAGYLLYFQQNREAIERFKSACFAELMALTRAGAITSGRH